MNSFYQLNLNNKVKTIFTKKHYISTPINTKSKIFLAITDITKKLTIYSTNSYKVHTN